MTLTCISHAQAFPNTTFGGVTSQFHASTLLISVFSLLSPGVVIKLKGQERVPHHNFLFVCISGCLSVTPCLLRLVSFPLSPPTHSLFSTLCFSLAGGGVYVCVCVCLDFGQHFWRVMTAVWARLRLWRVTHTAVYWNTPRSARTRHTVLYTDSWRGRALTLLENWVNSSSAEKWGFERPRVTFSFEPLSEHPPIYKENIFT